jgi:TRAP-type uncharacterized transport system substrate-binding protein
LPDEAKSRSFIMVSNVDQKMAMDKTGPYWHAYVEPMSDLRFVGAVARHAHGLVTLDDSIRNSDDLRGKRVGLIPRPSSLRALQEIVLLQAWGIYEDIEVLEFMRPDMAGALERGDVDVVFMPVAQMINGKLKSTDIDITRDDLHWVSLSAADVDAATTNTPVVADRVVFSPPQGATNGNAEVGLISFDAAWFTFASAPDDVVYEFLRLASMVCPATQPNCGGRAMDTLLQWPDLDTDLIHPGAQRFYRERKLIEE